MARTARTEYATYVDTLEDCGEPAVANGSCKEEALGQKEAASSAVKKTRICVDGLIMQAENYALQLSERALRAHGQLREELEASDN
jgi:hypothetical protein